jgi:diguanylate cyclase (GGDEF)-like protein
MQVINAALDRLITPTLTDERDLTRFVRRVTLGCVVAAVAFETFYLAVVLRDLSQAPSALLVTAAIATLVAYPVIRVLGSAQLKLYRAMSAISELTLRDPLTGIGNRRALMERVESIGERSFVLVVADIDRFKSINDRLGHAAGDTVIATTARRMADDLGDLGLVCRTGGEEFALLAVEPDPEALRRRLVAFARRVAAEPVPFESASVTVTISIGAAFGRSGGAFSEVYAAADRALYVAKSSGRDATVFDVELEALLDPPLPPDEVAWVSDLVDDITAVDIVRRPDAA